MPKQRDAERSRAKILEAAQEAFARDGYAQTGIRDIAEMAGVSSTLLLRYYGSKAGLFEAALIAAMPLDEVLARGKDGFGEFVAALISRPDMDIKPPAMIALAAGDCEAREIAARITQERAVAPLAKWLGGPDARVRAAEIVSLAVSFVLFTRHIPLMGEAGARKRAKRLAEALQAIVDQSG